MDKLRNLRNKTKSESINSNPNGILDKITKRYSTVSSKLLRRSPGRNSNGTGQPISGSYDMTGGNSDDHKPEIGAPILISKTILDSEYLDTNVTSLNNNNINSNNNNHITVDGGKSPNPSTTDSENEVFLDASNNLIPSNIGDIQFKFFPDELSGDDDASSRTSTLKRSSQSKSTQNICKTELQVFLQKSPSLEFHTAESCYDFPKRITSPTIVIDSGADDSTKIILNNSILSTNTDTTMLDNNQSVAMDLKEEVILARELFLSIEKLNQSAAGETEKNDDHHREGINDKSIEDDEQCVTPIKYLSNPSLEMDQLLDQNHHHHHISDTEYDDENNDHCSERKYSSKDSDCSSLKDFDMKSVSFESLHCKADSEFISIDELDWIKEEFNRSIDLEYCDHRDNLKPNERRITLLRNKNNRLVNLGEKKEKITNAWSGLKNWIGEEKGKIKEVVQRHAALQRVGGSTLGDNGGGGKHSMIRNQAFFDKIHRGGGKNKQLKQAESHTELPQSQRTSESRSTLNHGSDFELDKPSINGSVRHLDNDVSVNGSETGASCSNRGNSQDRSSDGAIVKRNKELHEVNRKKQTFINFFREFGL